MTLGQFIKEKRREKGVNCIKFSNKVGISTSHLRKIEEDKCAPTKDELRKIVGGLGVNMTDLNSISSK